MAKVKLSGGWSLSATFDRDLAEDLFGVILGDGEFVACPVTMSAQLRAVQETGRHSDVTTLSM